MKIIILAVSLAIGALVLVVALTTALYFLAMRMLGAHRGE